MVVHERALQFIERPGLRQALVTDDIGTIRLYCVLRAAAHRPPIDQDRAGAADAMLATDVDAIGLQLVAEKIAEQHARFGLRRPSPSIQRQRYGMILAGSEMERGHCMRSRGLIASTVAVSTARSTGVSPSAAQKSALAE